MKSFNYKYYKTKQTIHHMKPWDPFEFLKGTKITLIDILRSFFKQKEDTFRLDTFCSQNETMNMKNVPV